MGDGNADDTAAIQATIDALGPAGGTALIPAGTYLINVANEPNSGRPYGIALKSNVTLKLDPGAVLKVIPNQLAAYAVIAVYGISNASVVGGTLLGDKSAHTGSTGEFGFGIYINSSTDIWVDGITSRSMWGDGLFLKAWTTHPARIEVCNSVFDDNRRQGMSVTDVSGMVIRDCIFKNTGGTYPTLGTWPMAGLDLEPDPGELVENVQILRSQFLDNQGAGVVLTVAPTFANTFIKNVTIKDNLVRGNAQSRAENSFTWMDGIEILNTSGHTIVGNTTEENAYDGIGLHQSSENISITGNTVRNNERYGIAIGDGATANTVSSNQVCGNPSGQVHDTVGSSSISGNDEKAVCP